MCAKRGRTKSRRCNIQVTSPNDRFLRVELTDIRIEVLVPRLLRVHGLSDTVIANVNIEHS